MSRFQLLNPMRPLEEPLTVVFGTPTYYFLGLLQYKADTHFNWNISLAIPIDPDRPSLEPVKPLFPGTETELAKFLDPYISNGLRSAGYNEYYGAVEKLPNGTITMHITAMRDAELLIH